VPPPDLDPPPPPQAAARIEKARIASVRIEDLKS
jgi:hypothetical protein